MENKIKKEQKTNEKHEYKRTTDEEKVKLFEEFLAEHPEEKINSETVYKGYPIGTYVIAMRQKIIYKKGYCSKEVIDKMQKLGLLYEKRNGIDQKIENLAQYCKTNPYVFSREIQKIPESLQKDYRYIVQRRSNGKLTQSVRNRLGDIRIGGVFGFIESDRELLKQGKITERGLIQIYEEFNSLEDFKNAYIEYLVDMAKLKEDEDEIRRYGEPNELDTIKAELQEKHKKIFDLKAEKAINMQNFYNLNVPQEYINLYDGIFGLRDDGIIFDENTRRIFDKIINGLPQNCAELLKSRYGIDGRDSITLREIAKKKGVNFQTIYALSDKSIRKMKTEAYRQNWPKSKKIANEEFIRAYFEHVDVFSQNDNNHLPKEDVQKLSGIYQKRVKKMDSKEINKSTNIFLLELSNEARACLEEAGFVTVEDLINIDEEKIESLRKIDPSVIDEISSMIESLKEILNKNEIEKLENIGIEELRLSVRTYNALKRGRINTIQELINTPPEELLNLNNLGKVCLKEIESELKRIGLKFKEKSVASVEDLNVAELQTRKADEIEIKEIGLKTNVYRKLQVIEIYTVQQLLDKTDDEILNIKGFGRMTLREIKDRLIELGFLQRDEELKKEAELEKKREKIAELEKRKREITRRIKTLAKEILRMTNSSIDTYITQSIQDAAQVISEQQQELNKILDEIKKIEHPDVDSQSPKVEPQNPKNEIEEEDREHE